MRPFRFSVDNGFILTWCHHGNDIVSVDATCTAGLIFPSIVLDLLCSITYLLGQLDAFLMKVLRSDRIDYDSILWLRKITRFTVKPFRSLV